jgi:mono/diheme cytochrome c family protein
MSTFVFIKSRKLILNLVTSSSDRWTAHLESIDMVFSKFFVLSILSLSVLSLESCKKKEPGVRSGNGGNGSAEAGLKDMPQPAPGTPIGPTTLTDQSRSLEEILEKGTLTKDDCDRYLKGEKDRATTLRCGKWMYFYAHLEVPGPPAKLTDLLRENAPNTFGKSAEHFGLMPDPYSKNKLPVGMAPGPDMTAGVAVYTFTCASCHFGKLEDGRYVVGSPNHKFEFGKITLAISAIPELAAAPGKKMSAEVKAILDPITDEMFEKGSNRVAVLAQAITLLPSVIVTKVAPPDDEAKQALAISPSGVMDPYAPPSLDDGVAIPVRMSPLWGIDPKGMTAAGSTHGAMLGSNGGAPDLAHIMRTSSTISGKIRAKPIGENYKAENVQPLVEYVLSLQPPKSEKKFDSSKLAVGGAIFKKNCYVCHKGVGFAGTRVFDLAEIGTDPNVARLVDADKTGKALFNVLTPEELTGGIRARRLSGVWSMNRLLHNGSVRSLSDLFCLNGPRPQHVTGSGHSSAGHNFTCEGLSNDEKSSLIYFLESL